MAEMDPIGVAGRVEDGPGVVLAGDSGAEEEAPVVAERRGVGDMVLNIDASDRERVVSTIREAERQTSGEIVVVVATQSDDYTHVPLHVAAGIALAAPLALPLFAPLFPWATVPLPWLFFIQLASFIVFSIILSAPPIRYALTPKRLMRKYAHRYAATQFLVINTHATGGRTGVLIFVSLRERYCEIVADTAIALKVKDSAWQSIIDEMLPMLRRKQQAEALIHGIRRCSDLLAEHFPPGMPNPNEIPDNLFIIDAEGRSKS
jgi:putative membrane protein